MYNDTPNASFKLATISGVQAASGKDLEAELSNWLGSYKVTARKNAKLY